MPEDSPSATSGPGWTVTQVYVTAGICLLLGVALGYLFRGSQTSLIAASAPSATQPTTTATTPQMPTLEQMKHMADKQAEPLLAQLQSDPKNPDLLAKIGRIYESAHQFKQAAEYYNKSLAIKPEKVAIRNEMASCLYYTGDVDGALKQLERSLKDEPKNADSLFNLGVIRWQAKKDASGAVAIWKQLLKLNPNLEEQKKAQVQRLIADASQGANMPQEASNKF
jgi:Tfp pilus assembly protein PilF